MRIAYLTFESPTDRSGVGKKMRAQTAYWRAYGHEVHHIVLRAFTQPTQSHEIHFPVRKTIISPIVSASLNRRSVRQCLEALNPDVVYIRELLWWPGMYGILSDFIVIEEVNSDIRQELDTVRFSNIKRLLYRIGSRGHAAHIAGRVFVTHELRDRLSRNGERVCVIGNGADFSSPPAKKQTTSRPQIVMVNSADQAWQGVDLLKVIARRNNDYDFHLVGPFNLPDAPENLHLHGRLRSDELALLYEKIDVGLSTLALHRIGMTEACPLKIREYSEYGIPVAAGCADTDLSGADYFLDLSPFGTNLDEWSMHFRPFVEKWRNRPYPHEDARKRLSNEFKERKRVDFMQSILGTST